jgi:hypothetical protein
MPRFCLLEESADEGVSTARRADAPVGPAYGLQAGLRLRGPGSANLGSRFCKTMETAILDPKSRTQVREDLGHPIGRDVSRTICCHSEPLLISKATIPQESLVFPPSTRNPKPSGCV